MSELKFRMGHYYKLLEVAKPLYNPINKAKTGWFVHLLVTISFKRDGSGNVAVRDRRCFISLQRAYEKISHRLRCQISLSHLKEFVDRADEFYPIGAGRADRKELVKLFNQPLWEKFGTQLGKNIRKKPKREDYANFFDNDGEVV